MDRFARNFNLSSGAAAIVVACFLTVPCHKATAETPSAVQAEVTAQQNIDIKGRIVDQNGQPVIGASLFQQGTNNGTVADVDGRFSINVPNGASLKVSCLGYQDVIVTARNGMTIMMKEDNEMLSEVVVVGYGAQKRADITGAVASVDVGKTLESRPIADVGRGLQGAVPGMNIVVLTLAMIHPTCLHLCTKLLSKARKGDAIHPKKSALFTIY